MYIYNLFVGVPVSGALAGREGRVERDGVGRHAALRHGVQQRKDLLHLQAMWVVGSEGDLPCASFTVRLTLTYRYKHIHTHTYIYIYIYIYTCVCVCIYRYTCAYIYVYI